MEVVFPVVPFSPTSRAATDSGERFLAQPTPAREARPPLK
jgi:hypothetical protein